MNRVPFFLPIRQTVMMSENAEETFNYYFLKSNNVCPVCENITSSKCYQEHGIEYYSYLQQKKFFMYCPTCKKRIRSDEFYRSHTHGNKESCIWCSQSWHSLRFKSNDVGHLLLCFKEFLNNVVLPPKIPITNNDYFKENIKKKHCPICGKSLFHYSIRTLPKCHHQFHWACLSNWVLEYLVDYCPICFTHIETRYLKKYAYAIEWETLESYFYRRCILYPIISDKEVDYCFEVFKKFYQMNRMSKVKPFKDVDIYPRWTLERLKKRFAHITHYSDFQFQYYVYEYNMDSIVYLLNYLDYCVFPNETCLVTRNDSDLSCSICLRKFHLGEKNGAVFCKHIFHPKCISKWSQEMGDLKTCPICNLCAICLREFDLGNENVILPCKHIFHKQCISEETDECPVCGGLCAICLEEIDVRNEKMRLSCKHNFHRKCTLIWFQSKHGQQKTCPICRQKHIDGK